MNLLKTIWMCAALLPLLAGCSINEDVDSCPYNALLSFRYDGDVSYDIFDEKIDEVVFYVFGSDGHLVLKRIIPKTELDILQGANLKLGRGDYHIVCWGNVSEQSRFVSDSLHGEARLHPAAVAMRSGGTTSGDRVQTNDDLYFSSYDLHLPKHDIVAGELPFTNAHVNLKIYSKGAGFPTSLPTFEVRNLPAAYDFEMKPVGESISYVPAVHYDREKEAAVAELRTLRFPDDNDVEIDVRAPGDPSQIIYTVKLKEFMAQNDIHTDGVEEVTIEVLVEFNDLNIWITVPDWESEIIGPNGPGYN